MVGGEPARPVPPQPAVNIATVCDEGEESAARTNTHRRFDLGVWIWCYHTPWPPWIIIVRLSANGTPVSTSVLASGKIASRDATGPGQHSRTLRSWRRCSALLRPGLSWSRGQDDEAHDGYGTTLRVEVST